MKRSAMAVLLSTLIAPPLAFAQTANKTPPEGTQGASQSSNRATQTQQAQNRTQTARTAVSAADFVRQATASNMFEIQSSQLALDKTKDENLRHFAQRMIDDHTKAGEQLKQAAGNVSDGATGTDPRFEKMLKDLDGASGEEFNRLYIQYQRTAHQEAVQLFERYAQNGDHEQLKQFAQQTLPTLRAHLKTIEGGQRQAQGQRTQASSQALTSQPQGAQSLQQQDSSRIVVEREAPKVQVEQASPHITVRQAQPEVSVRQAQPELIVHQPQPTITVDIPQPVITVRMPQPEVNVQVPRPEIQVEQPKPQVHIQESAQPEIQVQAAQPTASVQEGDGGVQPRVQYAQAEGQPTIRYERAEPKVVINRPEGQPEVRIERMQDGQQNLQSQRQTQQTQQQQRQNLQPQQTAQSQQQSQRAQTARQDPERQQQSQAQQQGAASALMGTAADDQRAGMTEEERKRARERFGIVEGQDRQLRNRQEAELREVTVGDIENMDVVNERGEELGDVGKVVADPQGQQYVVITKGGFLGIGEDRVVLPMERFWVQDDRLIVHGVTEQDIDAMDDYRNQEDNYKDLDDDTRASVGVWK